MEITEWSTGNNGRRRMIKLNGISVYIEPNEDDSASRALAESLLAAPDVIRDLQTENLALRARVPPKTPARLLGPGCVRMRDGLWLLNKRAGGWASWGVRLDGWDDLFRRYNVLVTGHGEDEHGMWWEVSNA
jgi:hypothetical protein